MWFRGLLERIRNLFTRPPPPVVFDRKQMGPRFRALADNTILIEDRELVGQQFQLTTTVSEEEAHVFLHRDGKQLGHCDIQRNAFEATVVLWNIVVQDDLRHKGLASIMAYTGFRRMLELHNTASFGIRMIRLIRPQDRQTRVQNIGIGVIARKLGFTSQYNLTEVLDRENIQLVEFLDSDGTMPPAYRIVLKEFPLVLVAFVVDPFTQKPFAPGHPMYRKQVFPETVREWVGDRMIIIGNGNYMLRRDGIPTMINYMAETDREAQLLARRIRPVSN